jgi:predicted RNase H-like nuclease
MQVLGIDAAWTKTNPSGVALVRRSTDGWRLLTAQPSYAHFLAWGAGGFFDAKPRGGQAEIRPLLACCGECPEVIAVDMPLSRARISGRRASDDAISSKYGRFGAGTHSPSKERPGRIADTLRAECEREGYTLWTSSAAPRPGLVEVYPHPALIELTGACRRLPYKHAKAAKYWPCLEPAERKYALHDVWDGIIAHLEHHISGVRDAFDRIAGHPIAGHPKAFEDMLDAVVCAWVGICVLEQRACCFGDAMSAIWVPQ